jgi:hypothetical protein
MKIAFIAHPIGGDVKENLKRIDAIVRQVNLEEPNTVPFVPYYSDVAALDDSVPEERMRGIVNNKELFYREGLIDELRLYGDKGITQGMAGEVRLAWHMGITVVCKTKETEEAYEQFIKDHLHVNDKHFGSSNKHRQE